MGALHHGLTELCRGFGVSALYVFGSRAQEIAALVRGTETLPARAASDVDVGVVPAERRRLSVQEKVRLAAALEDLFGVGRVDLVVVTEASAFLAAAIVKGPLLYDADSHATAELELYVLRRAADLLPFEKERVAQVLLGGGR